MTTVKDKTKQQSSESEFLAYVAQKLEKIAHALYLVTNLFPADEPLRGVIRKKGIGLVSSAESIRHTSLSDASFASPNLSDTIHELVSLLSLARTSGLLSEMNHDVLKDECLKLTSLRKDSDIYAGPLLGSGDFAIPELKEKAQKEIENIAQESDKSTKNTSSSSSSQPKNTTKTSRVKRERRQNILNAIKGRGDISIKEIAKEVRGCSRKTIQRELGTLVDKGLVRKEGERRWSTYALTSEGRTQAQ